MLTQNSALNTQTRALQFALVPEEHAIDRRIRHARVERNWPDPADLGMGVARVAQIAHAAAQQHAPNALRALGFAGAGWPEDMRERRGIVGREGAEFATAQRHKCRNLVVPQRT